MFNRFLIFQIPQISNCECFVSVSNQLISCQFFSRQNSIIIRIFRLVIYKIDYFWCNYCSNSKVFYQNQNPNFFFSNFYFEVLSIYISHLTQLLMITMALKWHHKNISNKITILKEFWQSYDIVFGLFDCDYTWMASRLVLFQCKDDKVFFIFKERIMNFEM